MDPSAIKKLSFQIDFSVGCSLSRGSFVQGGGWLLNPSPLMLSLSNKNIDL